MKKDLQKAISIIASKNLREYEKVDQIRTILEKNLDIACVRISNQTFESMGQFSIVGPTRDKITLLHFAAMLNCVEVAKLLIEEGANVNAVSGDVFKDTPLHQAAFKGNKEVAELLLECNAKINSKDYYGDTPLHHASSLGKEEVVKLLLERGADVNAVTSDYTGHRKTPLHEAITGSRIDRYLRIVKMLLDYGANTEIEDRDNGTPLYIAAGSGQVEAIKLLLEAKANVNARNKRGETPLHVVVNDGLESASEEGCEAAELLLKHGADVNAKDRNGNTPLHRAALQRGERIVKLLLEYSANINETNNYGATALERIACCKELWESINGKVDPEPTVNTLIEQTLKNDPSVEKPEFIKERAKYSEYWDKCQLWAQPCEM